MVIYIRKNTRAKYCWRADLTLEDPDIIILEVEGLGIKPFYIINIYNELLPNTNNTNNITRLRTIKRVLINL